MKRVFINLFIVLLIFTGSIYAIAKDEKVQVSDEKKQYTEEEFHKAVLEEVTKRMIKLGRKEIVGFSQELLNKDRSLNLREMNVEKKEQELKLSQQDLNKKINDFESRQNKLLACLDDVEQKKEKRVQHMVDAISGMRPNSAADVLSVQDPDIAVKILGLLDPVKVSKIFNKMEKEISARLQKQYMTMKK